jgi:hypothetical protein
MSLDSYKFTDFFLLQHESGIYYLRRIPIRAGVGPVLSLHYHQASQFGPSPDSLF